MYSVKPFYPPGAPVPLPDIMYKVENIYGIGAPGPSIKVTHFSLIPLNSR